MRRTLPALLLLLTLAAPAAGAAPQSITRDAQRDVMLTIYNGNFGLVKDVREARFPAGLGEVRFMDVAALIDPTTVHLRSLGDPAGLKILDDMIRRAELRVVINKDCYLFRNELTIPGDGTFHE